MEERGGRTGPLPRWQSGDERRASHRYPLGLDLYYTILSGHDRQITGTGHVIDVSSSGVRFTADRPLSIGLKAELAIRWPVVLEGDAQLQLILLGTIVRTDGDEVGIEVLRHQFRTCGRRLRAV